MKFEKEKYAKSKEALIELIKVRHPLWETTEGFFADGVLNPNVYENEKLRILVILGESYNYDTFQVTNIEWQNLRNDMLGISNSKVQTPRKVAAMLSLLFEYIEIGEATDFKKISNLFRINKENHELLQKTFDKIAWINVRKSSKPIIDGDTRMSEEEIYHSCRSNKEILELQIASISPHIIIACSNPVFHGLLDNGLLGQGILKNKKHIVQTNQRNQKIMHLSHPSYYRDWGYLGIDKIASAIHKSIRT